MPSTLQQAALALLNGPTLAHKVCRVDVDALVDHPAEHTDPLPCFPAREPALCIHGGVDRLPKLRELTSPSARALCFHRFANHELQAAEMMAWAVLAFPQMPSTFRVGLLRNAVDEQRHLSLYLDRMAACGMTLGDEFLTGNFWAQARSIHTPLQFLCAMGLTFENANLDFSLLYRDAFRNAGALEDAAAMDLVHREEVGHVAWALSWVRRLKDPALSDLDAYRMHTPFPLGLHRAKGRNFGVGARRLAGMDEPFIEANRVARSPQNQDASW